LTPPNDPAPGTLIRHVRRRLWIVVVCALIGGAYSYHHAHAAPLRYEASAQLLFAPSQVQTVLGLAGSNSSSASGEATNASLAGLPVISQNTAKALGKRLPPGGVNVNTQALGTTNLVQVTAASPTPQGAALVANVYAYQVVYYMQQQQKQQLDQAITMIKKALASAPSRSGQIASLNQTLSNLELQRAVNPVGVSVAQPAVASSSPNSRKVGTKTIEGIILGLIIGVIIALIVDWLDPKLRDLTDLDLRGLRVVRPPGGPRPKQGAELSTVLARRILGESQVDPRLVAITSPGAPGDIRAAQQVSVALAQAARASGLTVAILTSTRSAQGGAEDPEDVEALPTDSLPRTELAEGVEQLQVPADALVRGTVAADVEAELRGSYGLVIVMEESPSEFSPFARLLKAADVSVLVVTLGRTNRQRAAASARSLARIASGHALLFACPAGFRAKLQKELTLQPVG
jgi:capsular polysaccharide biosynthesis protein